MIIFMSGKSYIYMCANNLRTCWWLRWSRICLQCGRPGFNPWVGKIPWRRKWQATAVFWPREFHGLYSPWGCKESDTTERLSHSHHITYIHICSVLKCSISHVSQTPMPPHPSSANRNPPLLGLRVHASLAFKGPSFPGMACETGL